jgi:hypothetical protein
MNRITRSPDFTLWIGVVLAVLVGAFLMRGTTHSLMLPALFFMLYFIVTVLQMLGFGFGISKAALNQGSGSAALRGFALVAKFAVPIYITTFILLVIDLLAGWRLASNPISLILYFFSIRFLVARDANRQNATSLLRGANPTSAADGVAAQRRQDAPDFSRAERPVDAAPIPMPNLNKAPAPSFADAVRPADED